MRGRQLVLAVGPRLALVAEGGPGVGVARGVGVGPMRGPLGKGLVEPQVVPPRHGHKVAEPHVCELMEDRVGPLLICGIGLA